MRTSLTLCHVSPPPEFDAHQFSTLTLFTNQTSSFQTVLSPFLIVTNKKHTQTFDQYKTDSDSTFVLVCVFFRTRLLQLYKTSLFSCCNICSFYQQADRGFARSRLCIDEDGTTNNSVILLYTVWNGISKKGGNAPRGTE